MHPRHRLDIGFTDLLAALLGCLRPGDREALERTIEARFATASGGGALVCLSARTALDLWLGALALPAGSEVLVSALTIPDMARVLRHHGLVPVPVDVELDTLAPTVAALGAAASERTRAVLVAHLLGGRVPMEPIVRLARERGWLVVEDAAQAFTGTGDVGHPEADAVLFSFGSIKTATALGSGVLRVRDPAVLAAAREGDHALPAASRWSFAARALRTAPLLALARPAVYGLVVRLLARAGRDLDGTLASAVRGFPGELMPSLRRRPCVAQLSLLAHRLERTDAARLAARRNAGDAFVQALGEAAEIPGRAALDPTHWVVGVLAHDPDDLVRALRRAGFDATRRASMTALPADPAAPATAPTAAARFAAQVVWLPHPAGMPVAERHRLAELVRAHAGSGS